MNTVDFDTRQILGLIFMAHSDGDSKHTAVLEFVRVLLGLSRHGRDDDELGYKCDSERSRERLCPLCAQAATIIRICVNTPPVTSQQPSCRRRLCPSTLGIANGARHVRIFKARKR